MSTMALYKALLEAHVSEDLAAKAVEDLTQSTEVAIKSDLKALELKIVEQLDLKIAAQLAQLETRLMWRMLGGTAILLSVTVALLKII